MVKIIIEPLTDINGRDFRTGKLVKPHKTIQEKGQQTRAKKWLKQKKIEASDNGTKKGKIHVLGLGWVTM